MPRKQHEPTKATRDTVSMHAMVGTPQEIIADVLNIDSKTLRKHYRKELDIALHQANASIGGALFNKAKNGDTTAQMFWLKTRAGWRERRDIDITTSGEPINRVERIIVDPTDPNA